MHFLELLMWHIYKSSGARSINESVSLDEVMDHGTNLIREEVLPALGPDEDRIKGYHLGYMTNRLIFAYLGRIPCDDRDHLQNKRFELAGPMLATLFRRSEELFLPYLNLICCLNNLILYHILNCITQG